MVNNIEKHQWAFCVSAVVLCAGLSLIATAVMVNSAISPILLVVGGVLTFLSVFQAIESYSFLQNSEKFLGGLKNAAKDMSGMPENKLFIERIFQPFLEVFGEQNRAR